MLRNYRALHFAYVVLLGFGKMKTALFTNMYLIGNCPYSSESRMSRALKFMAYYSELKERLGFERIYATLNGGNPAWIANLLIWYPQIKLIYHPHLERGQFHDYLPCWRTTHDWRIAIDDGFEKIICVDDDAFILSRRLIDHVRSLESGWESMWCPRWNFPECGLHVLCKDSFPKYFQYLTIPYSERNKTGSLIENVLPYTPNKEFNCDRWGETRDPQRSGMDAYFQCPVDIEMKAEA